MSNNIFNGKKVLVTGSTGFKGSWLSMMLLSMGAKVSGFALPPLPDAPLFNQLRLRERIRQHDGDIRDADTVKQVIEATNPEIIFHLAAQPLVRLSYKEPKLTFDTNVGGTINLLDAFRNSDALKALAFVTTDKVYRNKNWTWGYRESDELGGRDPYSASKSASEIVLAGYIDSFFKERKIGMASVRSGNVIGGGDFAEDRIVPDCIRAFLKNEEVVLRNPDSTRPWLHVLDSLSGYVKTVENLLINPSEISGAWNFGPDIENIRCVQELAELVVSSLGQGKIRIERDKKNPHEEKLLTLNCDKAKSILEWRCQWHFEDTVAETVDWYKRVNAGESAISVTEEQLMQFMSNR